MNRTYSELLKISSFLERYIYLRLNGAVADETFGFDRYLNQVFYKSPEWRSVRDWVIIRDKGCDLGVDGHEIQGKIIVHHMNPILPRDIVERSNFLMNPDYLISVAHNTHNAIHYGDAGLLPQEPVMRTKYDMCPWRH